MVSHVYLLAHNADDRFKVGKANDILSRAKAFDWDTIDFDRSLGLELGSERAAANLERILLRSFDAWRLTAEEVRASGSSSDGASEWLRNACRERLEKFLDDIADLFPHLRRSGKELKQELERRRTPNQSALDRILRQEQARAKAAAILQDRQARIAAHAADLDRALATLAPALLEQLMRQRSDGGLLATCEHCDSMTLLLHGHSAQEWTLDPHTSRYRWSGGSASLVSSTAYLADAGLQLMRLRLDLDLRPDGPHAPTFACHLELLRALPRIDQVELDAIFGPGLASARGRDHARRLAAGRILVTKLREHLGASCAMSA